MGIANQLRWLGAVLLLAMPMVLTAEDSLQSALNAVNRRQRDLSSEYRRYGDYDGDDNENLGFVSSNYDGRSGSELEKALLDYLEKRRHLQEQREPMDKISSSFRERVEMDRAKQRQKMAETLLSKLYNDDTEQEVEDDGDDYNNESYDEDVNKRSSYYNSLGWGSVGMRKRSRYFQPDGPSDALYLLNYAPRDEIFNRLEEEENNPESEYNINKYTRERKSMRYPFVTKRFPVAKRSSNFYQNEFTHQHKRSPPKEVPKTDPKVEKELNSIFNPKAKNTNEKKITVTKKPTITTTKPKKLETKPQKLQSKEEVPASPQTGRPLDMKKKSINWSDYFGLDRRKKDDALDNEWLIEHYHKSIATKRNDEYPLKYFHERNDAKPNKNKSEESQIQEMDAKLKTIEDSIVDDALKFTGSHEGTVDSKEVQTIKDKIITRLAAAYRLEKMRRALNEYKQNLEREHTRNENKAEDMLIEEKRVSVPRKQAVEEDRERVEEDNNIKCAQGDEDCDEQNYRPPSEFLDETLWTKGECPRIERACNEVATVLGHYGKVFEIACNMHQMCLLCGDNSWYTPTGQCNILYVAKADELCEGDPDCQRAARQSVKYLMRVNRAIRSEPLGMCDMECPDKKR